MTIDLRSPRSARSVSLAVVMSLLAADAGAGPGDLDVTFGTGGKVITDFGPRNDGADAVAIQADGKIVAAGYSVGDVGYDFALVRYHVDGSLDASFGAAGKVVTDISRFNQALALVIQADGKIVAAGDADLNFALARYNTDGSLDTTFDGDGIVTTAFAGFAMAWAVAIQPDGRIVAAGGENQSYLARYNSDGSLDLTFGVGGKVTGAPPSGWFTAVAIQADGRIVAAGRGDTSDDFVVSRYNTDGSPDVTFGTGGTVVTDFGGVDHLWGLAIQADGKIVAVGTGGNFHFALARYTSDGHLDPSFDGDGMVITPFSEEGFDYAGKVVIQTDGKIVVAGDARLGPFTEFDYSFAVARYNTDGGLDPTFGTGGTVTTDFEGFRSDDLGQGVALHADGRIVVAGRRSLCNPDCSGETFALVRYLGGEAGGPPDLVETSLTNPPSILLLKQKFSITDTVQNQGGGAAVGSITRYYLSLDTLKSSTDKLLSGKRSVPPLAPDATSTGLGKLTVAPSTKVGVYYLLACADDTTLVDEGNDTNNCLASSTTVHVRAPDLVEASVSNPPAMASPGESFSVTDTVTNAGNASAGPSTTRYYLSLDIKKTNTDPLLTGTRAITALAAGSASSGSVTVTIPAPIASASYYLLACADDLKKLPESNEKNNCRASVTKVTITSPSAVVSIVNFAFMPSTLTVASGTTVKWTNNQGVHSTTSDTGVWDSGVLSTGSSFSHTFNSTGTYPYHCQVHPGMMASIVVE